MEIQEDVERRRGPSKHRLRSESGDVSFAQHVSRGVAPVLFYLCVDLGMQLGQIGRCSRETLALLMEQMRHPFSVAFVRAVRVELRWFRAQRLPLTVAGSQPQPDGYRDPIEPSPSPPATASNGGGGPPRTSSSLPSAARRAQVVAQGMFRRPRRGHSIQDLSMHLICSSRCGEGRYRAQASLGPTSSGAQLKADCRLQLQDAALEPS